MTSATDIPVESGQGYTITNVDGHQPESLDDFTGDIHPTLTKNGQLLQLTGAGAQPTAESVRFYQKNVALHDRDVRGWNINPANDTTFLAAPHTAL